VRFQAMRELPFPLDEAQIDFAVLTRDSSNNVTEVLLAAVRNDILARLKATCHAAGLTPVRIGLRPYANLISVTRLPGLKERRVLFIDIGPSYVIRGGLLTFSRSAHVAVPQHSDAADAEGLAQPPRANLAELELAEASESASVEELVVEVTRSLQAYRATEVNAVLDQILIAGGTGIELAVLQAVDQRFGLPASLFDPTPALGVKSHEAVKLRSFSAALGLAWGMMREEQLEIDFLNPKKPVPPRETLVRRLRIGGLAAGVLLVGAIAGVSYDLMTLRSKVRALEKENSVQIEQARDAVQLDVSATGARDWEAEARMGFWLEHMLTLTEQSIDPGRKMLVTDLTCDAGNALITLKVTADSWDTVKLLIE
jgi:cell division ATPase FtsA